MHIDFSYDKTGKKSDKIKIIDFIGNKLYNIVDKNGNIIHKNCVLIPRTIENCIVTEIGEEAFSPSFIFWDNQEREIREKIECVYLPDTIRKIERNAFFNCTMLKDVYAPEESEIKISKFLSDGTLQSDGTFQADYIFPTLEICQSDVILQHVHPFTGCDPYLTIHHNGNTSWKSFCWDESIKSDDILPQQGIYHDPDYKSACEKQYIEFALHNNLAYLGISDDHTDIQIPLGERPYKVFRKKSKEWPYYIRLYAWVSTHFIWFKFQIGEFKAVDMPYNPYTNAHPKYISDVKNALNNYHLSIQDPKNLKKKFNNTYEFINFKESNINRFQKLSRFFQESISDILSRPFIGMEDYLELIKGPANYYKSLDPDRDHDWDFEWELPMLGLPEGISYDPTAKHYVLCDEPLDE